MCHFSMCIRIKVKEGSMKKYAQLFIAIIGSSLIFSACSNSTNTPTTSSSTLNEQTKTYNLSDVSSHNNPKDCWMAIDGNVYDVTLYIPNHPELSQIISTCGTDATAAFNKIGKHQKKALSILPTYIIGTLTK